MALCCQNWSLREVRVQHFTWQIGGLSKASSLVKSARLNQRPRPRTLCGRCFLILIFTTGLAASPGASSAAPPNFIADVEPQMFGPATTEFLPGAYRLNEATGQLTPLCLPSNGSWVKPGGGKCPLQAGNTAPPAATRYQMGLQLPAGVNWVVGNLGINTAQWQVAGNATGLLGAIGRSIQLTRVATAAPVFQYSFNGATLPSALDKEIPGRRHLHAHARYSCRPARNLPVCAAWSGPSSGCQARPGILSGYGRCYIGRHDRVVFSSSQRSGPAGANHPSGEPVQ